jgi:hypothetical protein
VTEFWWGVLALPLIALALSAAAAAVFGTWLLLEKWSAGRYRKLEPVQMPEAVGGELKLWTMGDLGLRGAFASVVLSGGQVRMLRLGSAALILAWGKPDSQDTKKIQRALQRALQEVAKEDQE